MAAAFAANILLHMGSEMRPQSGNAWPAYFQPRAGQESVVPSDASDRIAATLLDMLYLRPTETETPTLFAVIGCMGGAIDVVSSDRLDSLPDDVRDHVQMSCINQRNRFRIITAANVDVFRLDAVRLKAAGPGFNDPVQLFGCMQARITHHRGHPAIALVQGEGRLTVGRIDLLHSMRQGISRPLVSASDSRISTYHALIPTANVLDAGAASPLVLLYPLADPDVSHMADNEAIFRKATYNLISSLQSDMMQAGMQVPYTENRLPVPNRAQFIDELVAEGYEIRGNAAYKTDMNRRPRNASFLGQLWQSAESWLAPVVGLPLEGTLPEYGVLIDEGLAQVATDDDRKAMHAARTCVLDGYAPPINQPQAPPIAPPRPTREMPEPSPQLPSPEPSASVADDNHDWSRDFACQTRQAPAPPQRPSAWWADFADDDAQPALTFTMNATEPASGQPGTSSMGMPPVSSHAPELSPAAKEALEIHQTTYAEDFSEIAIDPAQTRPGPNHDWQGDFD